MSKMLDDLLESLYEMVEEAKSVPLSADKCIVSRNDVLYLIDDALKRMPHDLANAKDIVSKKESIINEAKAQAEAIVANASKQAGTLVDKEAVVLEAEAKAREIVQNAQTKSVEIKKTVSEYCVSSLLETEEKVAVILEELKTTRQNFKKNKAN